MQELSYKENSTVTLAAHTFWVLMAIVIVYDLEAHQYNVVSAFTNSQLDKTIYIECSDSFKQKNTYLLLHRVLYGLRQLLWL